MADDLARLGLFVDSTGVVRATDHLGKFGKEGQRAEGIATKFGKAGSMAFGAVAAAAAGAIAAVASLGGAISTIRQFETSMSQVSAITGATKAELEALRDVAKDLGSTTEFSAAQAADGLRFLGMAGFSAAESMKAIPAVLDLATASSMGLAESADIASNVLSGFGLSADDAAQVADVLAAASSRANTSVSQLGSAMSTVAPISAALGIDLSDTAAAIGVLSDAGIQGERAGTALRGVLASLAGPTDQARDALAQYGITAAQVNPETQSLTEIFGLLRERGLSTADAMTIFGREAASGALVLAEASSRVGEFGEELRGAEGAASDMASIMRDNLGGAANTLMSSVQGLAIAMGEAGLTTVLIAALDAATALVRGLTMLVEGIGAVIDFVQRHTSATEAVTEAMQLQAAQAGDTKVATDSVAEASRGAAEAALQEARAQMAVIDAYRESRAEKVRSSEDYQRLQNAINLATAELDMLYQTQSRNGGKFAPMTAEAAAAMDDLKTQLVLATRAQNELLESANFSSSEYVKLQGEVDRLEAELAQAATAAGRVPDELIQLSPIIASATGNVSALQGVLNGAAAAARALASAMASAASQLGPLGSALSALGGGSILGRVTGGLGGVLGNIVNSDAVDAAGNRLAQLGNTMKILLERSKAAAIAQDQFASSTGGAGGSAGGAAKEVEKLADEIQRLEEAADPTRKFRQEMEELDKLLKNGLSDGAYAHAVRELNEELVNSTPILSSVNDAFGQMVDYMFDGFKDGMKGILNIFVNTLKQMAATALKNRITIGLGLGVTGGAGAAAAGVTGGGGLSSLFGGSGFLGLGGGAGSLFGGSGLLGLGGGSSILGLGAGSGLATALGGGAFGAAASVALPVLGAVALVGALFKKTEVTVANGVRATIEGASLALDSYEKTKTNNGLGMSSGFDRDFTRLDDAVQSAVGARLSATVDALGAFGLGTDLTGFNFSKRTEIKDGETFEGESEEVIREALNAAVEYLADGALDMFRLAGEGLSDTLDRLVVSLNAVNPIVDMLGDNILPISLDGAAAASALADLAGGIEAFGNKAAFVFDSFLTDAEKLEIANGQLSAAFDTLNTALPETHAQFRELMDAQDLSTEAGRQLYAALLDVAPLFIQVKGTAQEAADALNGAAGALANTANAARWTLGNRTAVSEMASITGDALRDAENALRAAFAAEQDRVSAAYADQISAAEAMAGAAREQAEAASQSAQERVQLRESIADALERAYRDRRVLDALGARNQISDGTAFLRAAVAAGGTSDLLGLQQALDAVANPATALFGSFAEYQQDFNVNTNLIEQLKDLNAGQLSVEMRALRAAESTVDAVSRGAGAQVSAITAARDAQLAAMSAQMNALLGIDTSVMTVAQAIANLQGAQAALVTDGATSQFAAGSRLFNAQNVAGSLEYEINQRYRSILGRNVDAAGLDFYGGLIAAGGFSLSDLQMDLMRNKASDVGVPAFANGGSHSGGWRMVGERGPELEATGPSRIYSNSQSRSLMDTSRMEDHLAELNDRIRRMQIEINRQGTIFRDWNTNGQPGTREGAVVATQEVV